VASPKFGLWWVLWVLWVRVCLWLVRAPKCSNYTLTNLFGLCRSMWVIELFVILPSLIPELQHAPLPPKYCEPRSAPQLLLFPLFSILDLQLSPSKSLGVRQLMPQKLNSWHVYLDCILALGYSIIKFKNLDVLQCCNFKTFMASKCRNMVMMP
jgi:hypothetical protein